MYFHHQQHLLRLNVRHRIMHYHFHCDMVVSEIIKQQSFGWNQKESAQLNHHPKSTILNVKTLHKSQSITDQQQVRLNFISRFNQANDSVH